ncbi:MAG: methionine--tRNA ligase [Bdellovibrionales bacterium]
MKPFYITTPIYYVNDKPHLGTAYCTLVADTLFRFHKLFGAESFFLTGTDEHGQKVKQAAEKRGLTPQQHCDEMVKNFQVAWQELGIDYSYFIRTTSAFHTESVKKCLQSLFEKGDIYEATYEGWYSVSEEIFYTEKELVDGRSPTGKEVTRIQEKNFFFKMSKYQQRLIDHINKHAEFIQPDFRKNEVLGFLRQPLNDLCISRPKARMSWGIEIPFAPDYVTYVWFDALLNYATGVGYLQREKQADFQKWWMEAGPVHLIGKDILTTHCVYWTTMLMALEVALPRTIFAHGWILNRENAKMSKSEGTVIDPVIARDMIGLDNLRYFLVRDIHLGNDAPFSLELVENRINSELSNNLGNLLSRSANLVEKFFEGKSPAWQDSAADEQALALKLRCLELPEKVQSEVDKFRLSFALDHIVQTLTAANKYMEDKAPWKLAKTNLPAAGQVLATILEVLRVTAILLTPVLPNKAVELLDRIGVKDRTWASLNRWPAVAPGTPIVKGDPLFPRLDFSHLKGK